MARHAPREVVGRVRRCCMRASLESTACCWRRQSCRLRLPRATARASWLDRARSSGRRVARSGRAGRRPRAKAMGSQSSAAAQPYGERDVGGWAFLPRPKVGRAAWRQAVVLGPTEPAPRCGRRRACRPFTVDGVERRVGLPRIDARLVRAPRERDRLAETPIPAHTALEPVDLEVVRACDVAANRAAAAQTRRLSRCPWR